MNANMVQSFNWANNHSKSDTDPRVVSKRMAPEKGPITLK